jgi:hypothetical protein
MYSQGTREYLLSNDQSRKSSLTYVVAKTRETLRWSRELGLLHPSPLPAALHFPRFRSRKYRAWSTRGDQDKGNRNYSYSYFNPRYYTQPSLTPPPPTQSYTRFEFYSAPLRRSQRNDILYLAFVAKKRRKGTPGWDRPFRSPSILAHAPHRCTVFAAATQSAPVLILCFGPNGKIA